MRITASCSPPAIRHCHRRRHVPVVAFTATTVCASFLRSAVKPKASPSEAEEGQQDDDRRSPP